jgi:hypothetical protein
MIDTNFGVLLVRKTFSSLDTSFEYRSHRLPEPGEEVELLGSSGEYVRARVTGVDEAKRLPIRAAEL